MQEKEKHYYMTLIDVAFQMSKVRIKECLDFLKDEMQQNPKKFGDDFKNLQLYVNQKEKEEADRVIAE
jgi:hypothetical protein